MCFDQASSLVQSVGPVVSESRVCVCVCVCVCVWSLAGGWCFLWGLFWFCQVGIWGGWGPPRSSGGCLRQDEHAYTRSTCAPAGRVTRKHEGPHVACVDSLRINSGCEQSFQELGLYEEMMVTSKHFLQMIQF